MINPVQQNFTFKGAMTSPIGGGISSVRRDYKDTVTEVTRIQESSGAPIAGNSAAPESDNVKKLNVMA